VPNYLGGRQLRKRPKILETTKKRGTNLTKRKNLPPERVKGAGPPVSTRRRGSKCRRISGEIGKENWALSQILKKKETV